MLDYRLLGRHIAESVITWHLSPIFSNERLHKLVLWPLFVFVGFIGGEGEMNTKKKKKKKISRNRMATSCCVGNSSVIGMWLSGSSTRTETINDLRDRLVSRLVSRTAKNVDASLRPGRIKTAVGACFAQLRVMSQSPPGNSGNSATGLSSMPTAFRNACYRFHGYASVSFSFCL